MDCITIVLLAIALAMDCFAVSVTNGIALKQFHLSSILKMAFLFGFFQSIMPLITWLLGVGYKDEVEVWDHWIALVVLLFLGGKMIKESLTKDSEEKDVQPAIAWKSLIVLSIATSIDALATGFVFITESTSTFIFALCMIGLASFLFSVIGNIIGIYAGKHLPINMELVGGLVLIGIGVKIFCEHMGYLSNLFS